MLSRYDGKTVKITTTDGSVFIGEADFCPSGYGLVEFDRQEESVNVDDAQFHESFAWCLSVVEEFPQQ